jgi:hypothetical protein
MRWLVREDADVRGMYFVGLVVTMLTLPFDENCFETAVVRIELSLKFICTAKCVL